jgi:hypothetical protein
LLVETLEDRTVPTYFPTTLDLFTDPDPAGVGQVVTLSSLLLAEDTEFGDFFTPPEGLTVSFYDGSKLLGTGQTDFDGFAGFETSSLAVGPHELRATFAGASFDDFGYVEQYGASEAFWTITIEGVAPPPIEPPPTVVEPPGVINPPLIPPRPPAEPLPPLPASGTALRLTAVGADAGGAPLVRVFNADGSERFTLTPYDPAFRGGVRVAVGDVTGDGTPDVVTAPGPGHAPQVKVFNGRDGVLVRTIDAMDGAFKGGLFVAVADVNQDGHADLAVTPDRSGGPRVQVFSGADGGQLANFFGIEDTKFRGGARPSFGDLNADGRPDLLVSAGFGGGPRVAGFDGRGLPGAATPPARLFGDFFAFEPTLRNGCFLASGDLNRDGSDDLIAGGGPGGGPRVLALSGADLVSGTTPQTLANFFADAVTLRGGVNVSVADVNGDGSTDILAGPGRGGQVAKAFSGSGEFLQDVPGFDGFSGGVFVGGAPGQGMITSVRGDSRPLGEIAINGRFQAGVPTSVIYSDQKGFKVEVEATSVEPGQVVAGVPPYIDPATGQAADDPADLTVAVVQHTESGDVFSGTTQHRVDPLPESSLPPGTFTRLFLEEVASEVQETTADFEYLDEYYDPNYVDLDPIDDELGGLQDELNAILGDITAVQGGVVPSAQYGPVTSIGPSTLALGDRLLADSSDDLRSLDSATAAVDRMLVEFGQEIQDTPGQIESRFNAIAPLLGPLADAGSLALGFMNNMMQLLGGLIKNAKGIAQGELTPDAVIDMGSPFVQPVTSALYDGIKGLVDTGLNKLAGWGGTYWTGLKETADGLVGLANQMKQTSNTTAAGVATDWVVQQRPQQKLTGTFSGSKTFGNLTRSFQLSIGDAGGDNVTISLSIGGSPLDMTYAVGSGSGSGTASATSASGSALGNWTYYDPFASSRKETKRESVHVSVSRESDGSIEAMIDGVLYRLR